MRAISYADFGTAEQVLTLEDLPKPEAGPGEVLVRVRASGVNPSDVKARAGARAGVGKMPFPKIIPHSDGAGEIEAVGTGVDPDRIGQRVWIWNGQWQRAFGTAAEYIALPADQAVPLPETTSYEEGAVLGIPALTACHAVLGAGSVSGKRVLVSGGAGTVGFLAVQIAKASGAHVVATASGERGLERARVAGADHVLDYRDDTLEQKLSAANDGQPFDLIVEVEFGQNAESNANLIATHGRIVSYGSAKDMTPQLPFYTLMFKAVTIELILVYLLTSEQRAQAADHLNRLLSDKQLTLPIHQTFDLADCAKAHEAVEAGKREGAVILQI